MKITTLDELNKRITRYEDDIREDGKKYKTEPLVFSETDYEGCPHCGTRRLKPGTQSFQESGYHPVNNEMMRLKKIRDEYLVDVEIYNRTPWLCKLLMCSPSLCVVTYD